MDLTVYGQVLNFEMSEELFVQKFSLPVLFCFVFDNKIQLLTALLCCYWETERLFAGVHGVANLIVFI